MSPDATPDKRLTFQEVMSLIPLPNKAESGNTTKRYMSQRRAWSPEGDIPIASGKTSHGQFKPFKRQAAYGGHVYSQAGLAASITFSQMQAQASSHNNDSQRKFGIHVRRTIPKDQTNVLRSYLPFVINEWDWGNAPAASQKFHTTVSLVEVSLTHVDYPWLFFRSGLYRSSIRI